MEVIHQLILRTFDHKINEENINSNVDEKKEYNSKKNIIKKDATNDQVSTALLNVEIALNEAQPNNLKENNYIEAISNNLKNTEVNASNISTKQSTDISLASINEKINNIDEKQLMQKKSFLQSDVEKLNNYTTSQILQEPELELPISSMNDSDAVDPLELSSEFNCNDEFVNTNLLDNAELLKNFTPNSSDMFSKSAEKTEDSDIEILESEEKITTQRNVEDDVKKTAEPAFFGEAKAENKEQIVFSSTTEMKCQSEEALANVTAQSDKPLTLDDIKDTGRIGHELYKCGYLECSFTAPHVVSLKAHIKMCTLGSGEPIKNLFCPHCKKRFVKIGLLLEHMKTHGLKRFGCSMCKMRYPVSYQATAHMKTKHKFLNTKLVPADPTNPSVDGLFIVQAIVSLPLIFNIKNLHCIFFFKRVLYNFCICNLYSLLDLPNEKPKSVEVVNLERNKKMKKLRITKNYRSILTR